LITVILYYFYLELSISGHNQVNGRNIFKRGKCECPLHDSNNKKLSRTLSASRSDKSTPNFGTFKVCYSGQFQPFIFSCVAPVVMLKCVSQGCRERSRKLSSAAAKITRPANTDFTGTYGGGGAQVYRKIMDYRALRTG